MSAGHLVDHFFRHEYGRVVAVLSRRVGMQHIDLVEDAVQSALMAGLESWTRAGLPDNPSAWLFRVAYNNVVGELRQRARRERILGHGGDGERIGESKSSHSVAGEVHPVVAGTAQPFWGDDALQAGEAQHDLLRMVFVCCDESLPVESQLVLALKILCGFDVREIADRLFTTKANVYKRLERARSRLRQLSPSVAEVAPSQFAPRLVTVHKVLYLLFTEGHLSSHAELSIRRELCEEAIRLATIVAEHPACRTPETCALLALMHLHAARMAAREDASGGLLLLEEQDRGLWDQQRIQVGLSWLAESASGEVYSRYHAEAAIAAEHCLAPSFRETRWERVVECYSLLERTSPSPLHRLNRALAVAEWKGAAEGLALVEGAEPPTWLSGSYLWAVVLADLHRRCGNGSTAERYRATALALAPTTAVRALLLRRLGPTPEP